MKEFLIELIRFYQIHLSPIKRAIFGHTCKFQPTCSQYGIEAVQEYGAVKGGLKTVWRILRCNPFNEGGYDPVKKGEGDVGENSNPGRRVREI